MFQMPPNGMLVDLEVGDLFPVDATEMEAIAGGFFYELGYNAGLYWGCNATWADPFYC